MPDKYLNRFIVFFYLLAFFYALLTGFVQKATGISFNTLNYFELVISLIFNYGIKFIFIAFAIWFTKKYLIESNFKLITSVAIHTLISLLLTAYASFFLIVFENFAFDLNESLTLRRFLSRISFSSSYNFFVYFSMIAMVYAFYYLKKQKNQELRESNLKAQLLDSKINALQSQLQPHFLFNALNDISSLVDIDKEKSQNAIADLSDLLRKTLSLSDVKFITLKEELSIAYKYIDIEKIRFGDKLEFKTKVSDSLLNQSIPPLIIQPILENSIKHGFSYNHDTISITLKIFEEPNTIVFQVFNNGNLLPDADEVVYGNGLRNILERLQSLYQNNFSFEMRNSTLKEKGVLTILKLPFNN